VIFSYFMISRFMSDETSFRMKIDEKLQNMANFIRSLTLACNSEHHTTNNHSAIGDSSNLNHDDDS